MSERPRITFLVGAGLVKDAGLPMSVELANKLKSALVETGSRDDDSEKVELARKLLSLFRFLNGGVRFQEGFLDRDPDAEVNIEQIAAAALSLRQRLENPIAPYTSGWHQRLSELEAVDSNLMSEFEDFIYSQLANWLALPDATAISYLARLGDSVGAGNAIDVYSLNYDLCIETALQTGKLTMANGFSEDGWNPELFDGDPDVRLFKLHGSLDWVDDSAYGVCSLEVPMHKDAEDIVGTQRPLLIFGTNDKLSARQPFLSLAYFLSQSVARTPVLVVIGYSFGDQYVNEIIEQGFRNNSALRVLVVSPDAKKSIKSRQILDGSPKVRVLNLKAKEALNDGHVHTAIEELLADSAEDEVF